MNRNFQQTRHSGGVNSTSALADSGLPAFGAGRNPVNTQNPRSGQTGLLSCFAGVYLTIWIPAYAGMTLEGQ
jgi:hypothetical protein